MKRLTEDSTGVKMGIQQFRFAALWDNVLKRKRRSGEEYRSDLAHAIETDWTSPNNEPTAEQMAEAKEYLVEWAQDRLLNKLPDGAFNGQEPWDLLEVSNIAEPKIIWEAKLPYWMYTEDEE